MSEHVQIFFNWTICVNCGFWVMMMPNFLIRVATEVSLLHLDQLQHKHKHTHTDTHPDSVWPCRCLAWLQTSTHYSLPEPIKYYFVALVITNQLINTTTSLFRSEHLVCPVHLSIKSSIVHAFASLSSLPLVFFSSFYSLLRKILILF